jgi:hypothetical protein
MELAVPVVKPSHVSQRWLGSKAEAENVECLLCCGATTSWRQAFDRALALRQSDHYNVCWEGEDWSDDHVLRHVYVVRLLH